MLTTIFLEKYLLIMGVSIISSIISMIIGIYYFVKAFFMAKSSSDLQRTQHFFITGIFYFLIVPVIVLIACNNFLTPMFAISEVPFDVEDGILIQGIEVVHDANPIYIYILAAAITGGIYWLCYYVKYMIDKKKQSS